MSEIKEQIQKLRKLSSAGIMDCKKALEEAKGNIEEAEKILRKKGIAKAETKADRTTSEGYVASYLHYTGKLGVLVEVLCETDFVSRSPEFRQFTNEIAIHIAATEPRFVKREDVPEETIKTEKEVYSGQIKDKPANVVEKIVEGKLEKFYKETCLMEQMYYKDDKKTIEEFVKEHIAKFGENIKINRFTMYEIK